MKSFITLAIAILLTFGLSAQARFEFAPSVGGTNLFTAYDGERDGFKGSGISMNYRFLFDFKHIQIGSGITHQRIGKDVGDALLKNDPYYTQQFLNLYAMFNYKFARLGSSYFYAGGLAGITTFDELEIEPLFGGNVGWVNQIGKRIDVELSGCYNFSPNTFRTVVYSGEYVSGYDIVDVSMHTFTLNLGVRMHREQKTQPE